MHVEGRGEFVLELFPNEAPLHVGSFLALARSGCLVGQTVAAVGVDRGVVLRVPEGESAPTLLNAPLPPEVTRRTIARGSLLGVSGFESQLLGPPARGETARQVRITLIPRPELEGSATCWGRVSMGMFVVDRLQPGDAVAAVEVID